MLRKRVLAGLSIFVLTGSLLPQTADADEVPRLRWNEACTAGKSYRCATLRVPLDYDNPNGRKLDIKLIKRAATGRRIGTLFFQSGGPGEALTTSLPKLYHRFPAAVRERFDIVGFDQRGVGESTAVQCFPNSAEEAKFLSTLPAGFPVGRAQERAFQKGWARFAALCAERNPHLLTHVSTANAARDLDRMRQAVGVSKINYYGLSYGTFLGVTYANLFPGRVRSMVLDAVLEPVAYTTGRGNEGKRLGAALRLREDVDRLRTLNKFLDLCGAAGPDRCAFAAGVSTREKYDKLMKRLAEGPIRLGDQSFTKASTVAAVTGALDVLQPISGYVDYGWPQAAQLLQQLWQARRADKGKRPAPSPHPAKGGAERYAGIEQSGAIICSEVDRPTDPAGYSRQADWAARRSGDVGRMAAWKLEPCASWGPMDEDRYTGPWNRRTSAPILIMSSTLDPSDPYRNARSLARRLSRARLVTIDGYGHGAIMNKSSCAEAHESAYLINGILPAEGIVCRQDFTPFA